MNIKSFFDKLVMIILAVLKFIFSRDTLITLLFILGLSIVLYTIHSLSLIAFGFTLGFVLIAASLLIYVASTPPKQK